MVAFTGSNKKRSIATTKILQNYSCSSSRESTIVPAVATHKKKSGKYNG